MRVSIVPGSLAALLLAAPVLAADAPARVPYYASISASRAKMRTGPARTYPASWLYQRAGLPVRVVGAFEEWRQVEDQDGARGWMQANLLSRQRTAVVVGGEPAPLREAPTDGARLLWRAAPGVVGKLSRCADGWCRFDAGGRAGFARLGSQFWGVGAGEVLP